jgi:hypothetical protein
MIILSIYADSVKAGQTYTINDAANGLAAVIIEGKYYQTFSSGSTPQFSLSVKIDQHSNGWVSGTFSGKLGRMVPNSNPSAFEDMTVTEGSFKTKVVY